MMTTTNSKTQYVNGLIVPNFSYRSCACKCCGELIITPMLYEHMSRLQGLRLKMRFPIVINSGHRCHKHNLKVGGAAQSMHLKFATDIRPLDGDPEKLQRMYSYIVTNELFDGVGIYHNFIHVDLRGHKARWTQYDR